MPGMKPIDRMGTTLADSAYQRISEALLAGTIEPGARLVMDQLAEQLDISRTPVRDALLRLEREGMIEPSGRRGYTVREFVPDDSVHLYQAREAVECYSARMAAELGKPAFDYIKKVVDSVGGTDLGDVQAVYRANLAVHRSFVEVLENPVMLDVFDEIWQGARGLAMFADYLAHERNRVSVSRAHEPLVRALRKGPEAAYEEMSAHIRAGLDVHKA
ncbi:GntR family transcriptional regulator [Nocardioides terrisoli]|uniref:GntR family transcriptional regulator n=1 Tax=Nocardioides terrisoli TaxID=3388267 RepID=UPI00287B5E8D|nr:GntR family transcriptional regulator [Nocardioides marmorisolisilvae]